MTMAGIGPVGLDTASADRPPDLREQQMLQRAMARLEPAAAQQAVRVGRYVLLDPVGTGGMGIVYGGYDDVLDRRVAIKLIRAERAASEAAQLRLVREAQAMAKLTHPGVVAVYEAGVHDGDVYLAMELVEGLTLRGWLRAAERSWREIAAVFAEVADALAAAHDAGVLHRDFKPENVLVTKAGRPKVADFGLAHLVGGKAHPVDSSAVVPIVETPSTSLTHASLSGSRARDTRLTTTGEVMGTPAYMSPEQCRGEECGPASDQFAFFVSLFESLWGERPFTGDNLRDIMANIAAANVVAPRVGVAVPAWLRAVVLRGLAARPGDRHASMHAVASALRSDPRRRRARALATAGVLGIGVLGLGVGAWAWISRDRPCRDAATQIERAWSDAIRTRTTDAIAQTDLSYASDTAARVARALDAYADEWSTAYTDACMATRVHQTQSEDALDRRMSCLHRARDELAARVGVLGAPDATVVEHAMQLVDRLPPLAPCADLERLRSQVRDDDPAVAEAASEHRRELSRAFAMHVAGKPRDALVAMRELSQRVHELGANVLAAEVDFRMGEVLAGLGQHDASEPLLRDSMRAAMTLGDDITAGLAASSLVMQLGTRGSRAGEAQWVSDIALALAERSNDTTLRADAYNSRGGMLMALGKGAEAEAEFRKLLALVEREAGEGAGSTAVAHENLGLALSSLGRIDEAIEHHRKAMAIRVEKLGEDHPRVGSGHAHLGTALQEAGRLDEAAQQLRQGIAILARAFGEHHPDVAFARVNLGIVLDETGRHAEAQVEYRASIAVLEALFGRDHPDVAKGINNLGTSLQDEGRLADAEVEFRRALVISRAAFGEDHADVARTLGNLASVLRALGRLDEALAEAQQGLAISQRILPPDDPDLAYAHHVVGEVAFALAQSRWAEGKHADARVWCAEALTHEREAGEDAEASRIEIERWLAAHAAR
jgi:serine/threonine-protein kinase